MRVGMLTFKLHFKLMIESIEAVIAACLQLAEPVKPRPRGAATHKPTDLQAVEDRLEDELALALLATILSAHVPVPWCRRGGVHTIPRGAYSERTVVSRGSSRKSG